MYYAELQEIFGRMPFGLRNYWSGRFLRELPDELIEQTVAYFEPQEVRGSVLLEPLHGAASRVPLEATAFAGRGARYNATFTGAWADANDDERNVELARGYSATLGPWAVRGGYLNYASETSSTTLENEFGERRLERLRAVKREVDPENRFRFNHNIVP
jgi:FAD/FMN-containing dehydrogenase